MRCTHTCEIFTHEEIIDRAESDINQNYPWPELNLHTAVQNTESEEWKSLLHLVEEAILDERQVFSPKKSLGDIWCKIITLPKSIANLKAVTSLDLYGSNLLSIPVEVGQMENLEDITPYTSYGLHWFPYEITKCKKLRLSTVSTRALYGNFKYRLPFPRVNTEETKNFINPQKCSVCGADISKDNVIQVWISLQVATDVLPLLVNACSEYCINSLPPGAEGYIEKPHQGGTEIIQPRAKW